MGHAFCSGDSHGLKAVCAGTLLFNEVYSFIRCTLVAISIEKIQNLNDLLLSFLEVMNHKCVHCRKGLKIYSEA